MDLISKQTRGAFREHLVGWTLRTITDLFDEEDVPRGTLSSPVSGARRELVSEYYAGIDWTSAKDIRKIVKVYETILNGLEGAGDSFSPSELRKLTNLLRRDGFVYENARLVPAAGIDLKGVPDASEIIDRATLHDHVRRIEQSVEQDPAQAIGSAKELIESVAKLVLTHHDQDPERYDTLQQLVKHALKHLDLSIESIPDSKKGTESIKQVLSALSQIVGGTAELRNLYGTGHGRTRPGGLEPRHARLVVGAAATLSRFLLETLDARRKDQVARSGRIAT